MKYSTTFRNMTPGRREKPGEDSIEACMRPDRPPSPQGLKAPAGMRIEIRVATESDLPEILALYAQPGIDPGINAGIDAGIDDSAVLDREAAANLFRRIASYPRYSLYVALADGGIRGSFALLIMDNLAHLGAPSGIVEDVVVDPAYHRKGIGTSMMKHAITECRKHRCYKLALSADRKRKKAHSFYEALGFERHGYSYVIDLAAGRPSEHRNA